MAPGVIPALSRSPSGWTDLCLSRHAALPFGFPRRISRLMIGCISRFVQGLLVPLYLRTFTYRLLKAVSITGPRTTFDCCCVLCLRTHEVGILPILGAVPTAGVDECLGKHFGVLFSLCLGRQILRVGLIDIHVPVDQMEQIVPV